MMEVNLTIIFKLFMLGISLFPVGVESGEFLAANGEGEEVVIQFTVEKEENGYEEAGDSYFLFTEEDSNDEVIAIRFIDNALYQVNFENRSSGKVEEVLVLDMADLFSEIYNYKDNIGDDVITLTTSDGYKITVTPKDAKLIIANKDTGFTVTIAPEPESPLDE